MTRLRPLSGTGQPGCQDVRRIACCWAGEILETEAAYGGAAAAAAEAAVRAATSAGTARQTRKAVAVAIAPAPGRVRCRAPSTAEVKQTARRGSREATC